MSVLLSVFGLFLTFLFSPTEPVNPVENMDKVQTTMVECTAASFGRKLCRTTHYDDGASCTIIMNDDDVTATSGDDC